MNRMNRREFLSVLGGASAVSMMGVSAFSATSADKVTADITSLYVKGLVMLDLGNLDVVRLGFPKAPGHKATLSILPQNGTRRTMAMVRLRPMKSRPLTRRSLFPSLSG